MNIDDISLHVTKGGIKQITTDDVVAMHRSTETDSERIYETLRDIFLPGFEWGKYYEYANMLIRQISNGVWVLVSPEDICFADLIFDYVMHRVSATHMVITLDGDGEDPRPSQRKLNVLCKQLVMHLNRHRLQPIKYSMGDLKQACVSC